MRKFKLAALLAATCTLSLLAKAQTPQTAAPPADSAMAVTRAVRGSASAASAAALRRASR